MAVATGTMKLVRDLTMEISECINCGVVYGVTAEFDKQRRRDGKDFYCPNGHSMKYGQPEAERAREETARLKRELDFAQRATADWRDSYARETRRHSATKGQLTRARKRIQEGVCVECSQKFPDLEVHMKTEHPYAASEALE